VGVFELGDLPVVAPIQASSPAGSAAPPQKALADLVVRFVGEPIVLVVAESRYLAEDAVDEVIVDIEPLEAVMTMGEATDPRRAALHESVGSNVLATEHGRATQDLAIDSTCERFDMSIGFARIAPFPLEGRAIIADLAGSGGTVWVSSQGPHYLQTGLARCLGLPEAAIRVVSPDVGGGFGSKLPLYQEYVAVAAAARKIGRPVKWTADRREELLTSCQAREQTNSVDAWVDEHGRVQALDVEVRTDGGAYSIWPQTALLEPIDAVETYPGPYDIPQCRTRFSALITNKPPTGPYRGISRVHCTFALERLMDEIAYRLGIDPFEVRRRNVITEFPHRSAAGMIIETGSFIESLDLMAAEFDLPAFRREQQELRARGEFVGFGMALAIEPAVPGRGIGDLGADVMNHYETATVRIEPDGSATVHVGTHSHGQGHETTFAQVTADALGIEIADIRVRFGDTGAMPYGSGTWASRSAVLGSGAILLAADRVIAKGQQLVAALAGTPVDAVEFHSGGFHLPDGRTSTWRDLGRLVNHDAHLLPSKIEPGLEAVARYVGPDHGTVSNRLHACRVRVDTATGLVEIQRYLAIEDCGNMINPQVVAGQVFGGVAQGIGQALFEAIRFDEGGQPQSTTMLDYLIPTLDSVPTIELLHLSSPPGSTPLGLKGMGEGGVIPPPAALANAITDALRPFGISIDETPITPAVILHRIAQAKDGT
jgi:aerobic carbon-monoxide dehydrogenase large subunit